MCQHLKTQMYFSYWTIRRLNIKCILHRCEYTNRTSKVQIFFRLRVRVTLAFYTMFVFGYILNHVIWKRAWAFRTWSSCHITNSGGYQSNDELYVDCSRHEHLQICKGYHVESSIILTDYQWFCNTCRPCMDDSPIVVNETFENSSLGYKHPTGLS